VTSSTFPLSPSTAFIKHTIMSAKFRSKHNCNHFPPWHKKGQYTRQHRKKKVALTMVRFYTCQLCVIASVPRLYPDICFRGRGSTPPTGWLDKPLQRPLAITRTHCQYNRPKSMYDRDLTWERCFIVAAHRRNGYTYSGVARNLRQGVHTHSTNEWVYFAHLRLWR